MADRGEYMTDCIFCNILSSKNNIVWENELSYAIFDKFPVNGGHMLIISKRHVETFFDLTEEEQISMIKLSNKCKEYLDEKYKPDGYNLGLNCSESAGESIMHVHMHLIPRYEGDVENPLGGVRGVIPSRKEY